MTVVGCGLLGGSLGLALRAAGFDGKVLGVARHRETLELAMENQCIDEGTDDLAAAAEASQLVVVATPVSAFDSVFETLAASGTEAVISDVGSTKVSILDSAAARLRRPERFVGAHPMAGSTEKGPGAARADLFNGKPCILTPTETTDPQALAVVEAMWRGLGMRLIQMTAQLHDESTALFSHLPHLVAAMLVDTAEGSEGWAVASTGFRDTTRLASSNPPMRRDIVLDNRQPLLAAIERFEQQLNCFKEALGSDDGPRILELFERARDARDRWMNGSSGG